MLVYRLAEVVRPFASSTSPSACGSSPRLLLSGVPSGFATVNSVVAGLALVALSLPRGRRSAKQYGGWDRFVVFGRIG